MDRLAQRSLALRALMTGQTIVRAVGGHDALTAQLAAEAGFEAMWASSLTASAGHGVPDASVLTMTQFLDIAETMTLATTLPVIADGDTGFGDARNLAYAVSRYEARGIAGICVEDKRFPKINSFAAADQHLLPAAEFAAKIRAGKDAQQDSAFVLIARTEALIAGGELEEALERAHHYADAGADAILVHSKSSHPDQVLKFGASWDRGVPLVAIPTTYPQVTEAELHDAGYGVVIYANHSVRATIHAIRDTLGRVHDAGTAAPVEGLIAPMADVFALQGMPAPYRTAP